MCNRTGEETAYELTGSWTAMHLQGVVVAGGFTMPYPAIPPEPLAIVRKNNMLRIIVDDQTLELHPVADKSKGLRLIEFVENDAQGRITSQITDMGVDQVLSEEFVKAEAGCATTQLPLYYGTKLVEVPGEGMMMMQVLLVHTSELQAFGILVFQGGIKSGEAFTSIRSVRITKYTF